MAAGKIIKIDIEVYALLKELKGDACFNLYLRRELGLPDKMKKEEVK